MKNLILVSAMILVLGGATGCVKNGSNLAPTAPSNSPSYTVPSFAGQISAVTGGSLSNPTGVAVDANGYLYVADAVLNKVFEFTPSGAVYAEIGQTGNGDAQFNDPFGVAVDNKGGIYVADFGNKRVQELDGKGSMVKKIDATFLQAENFNPMSMDVQTDGTLMISDANNTVWQVNVDSTVKAWGAQGNLNGIFIYPVGMATDSAKNVYTADYQGGKVTKFNPTTNTSTSFGTTGTGPGQFTSPTDVKTDSNGKVYVVDSGNNRIEVFDANLNYLGEFGRTGTASQTLNTPLAMAIDSNGNIYVSDNGNHRVVKYTL